MKKKTAKLKPYWYNLTINKGVEVLAKNKKEADIKVKDTGNCEEEDVGFILTDINGNMIDRG